MHSYDELLSEISYVTLEEGVLDFEGFGIFVGNPVTKHGQIETVFHLTADDSEFEFEMGSLNCPEINSKIKNNSSLDYSFGAFTTIARTGIPIFSLPYGKYIANFSYKQDHLHATKVNILPKKHSLWCAVEDKIVGSVCNGETWIINVLPALQVSETQFRLEAVSKVLDINNVTVKGTAFIDLLQSKELKQEIDLYYILVGTESSSNVSANPVSEIFQIPEKNISVKLQKRIRGLFSEKKSYEIHFEYSLSLSDFSEGSYEAYLTIRRNNVLETVKFNNVFTISGRWQERKKPSIGVIGSCVTMDNFNSKLAPSWKKDFILKGSHYQMSLVSLMAQKVNFNQLKFPDLGDFDFRMTKQDFEKTFLGILRVSPPDFLLIDTFADARSGVIKIDDGWVTDNAWKIGISEYYKNLGDLERRNLRVNSFQYKENFKRACTKLKNFLERNCPNTQVVLIEAYSVERFRGIKGSGKFPLNSFKNLNQHRSELNKIVEEVFNCPKINAMSPKVFASSDHPWGVGSVHYEDYYYQSFRKQLLKVAGYNPEVSAQ